MKLMARRPLKVTNKNKDAVIDLETMKLKIASSNSKMVRK